MDIEDFTSKLILEYVQKIEDCQLLINQAAVKNRVMRRENASMDDRHDVLCELRKLNAQVIAYTQAKVDISSIQQELGI